MQWVNPPLLPFIMIKKSITSSLNPCTWTPITDMMDTEKIHTIRQGVWIVKPMIAQEME